MEYGLIVNKQQLIILDNNNIQYYFHDGFDLFSDESEQCKRDEFDILFDSKEEREQAVKILDLLRKCTHKI